MTQPICLLGHNCTGHGDFPARPNSEADEYLLVNGKPVHCEGHAWSVHCNLVPVCHGAVLAGGSVLMTVNGRAVGRIGDAVSCGGSVAEGDEYFVLD